MRRLSILAVVLFISIIEILPAQDNYEFGPSIRVNDDPAGTYSHRTTQRAIACSGDTVYLVWGDNRSVSAQVVFSRSTDAGISWSPNIVISQNIDTLVCVLPHIVLDASGNIYVVYIALHDNMSNADIYMTKSIDYGTSFTPAVMVNDSASVYHQRYPAITVDSSGQYVYVVWEDSRNIQYEPDIYFSRSTDGGVSFLPSIQVNDDLDTTDHWYPVIACNESGQYVYVAWMDERDTLHGWDVYFSRSADYGQTFEVNYPVNDTVTTGNTPQDYPSIYYKNDVIYASWHDGRDGYAVYEAISIDNGLSFGNNVRVADDSNAHGYYASITADHLANIYIVWRDYRNFSTFGHEIYFAFSADSGQTFEENVLVNDHEGIVSAWDWDPAVCVNDSGKVFVAWSSTRNDPAFNKFDIYCAAGIYVGIEEYHKLQTFLTFQCYPNPFAKRMNIMFDAECSKKGIKVKIYNATGRLVRTLYDKIVITSNQTITWDGKDDRNRTLSNGIYFVTLEYDNDRITKKAILLR